MLTSLFGYIVVGSNSRGILVLYKYTVAPFGCADKPAEKHCRLICCERKILFRLKKNKLKKTDYKPDEQGL
jgi:hypothetical protein